MKVKYFFTGAALVALLMLSVTFFTRPDVTDRVPGGYDSLVTQFRADKDQHFRSDEESPIENPREFGGLRYFPSDTAYRRPADWVADTLNAHMYMRMTDGKEERFVRAGRASFVLNELPLTLTLFRRADAGADAALFLPFTDATNGTDTYGGGRYLDVPVPRDGVVVIDFNFAYNPYCAYNDNYSCPVPPRENHLDIPVAVGEKLYPFSAGTAPPRGLATE